MLEPATWNVGNGIETVDAPTEMKLLALPGASTDQGFGPSFQFETTVVTPSFAVRSNVNVTG